jgi:hypothetical protein
MSAGLFAKLGALPVILPRVRLAVIRMMPHALRNHYGKQHLLEELSNLSVCLPSVQVQKGQYLPTACYYLKYKKHRSLT